MAFGPFRRAAKPRSACSLSRRAGRDLLATRCERLENRRVFAGFPVVDDMGPRTAIQTGQSVELFVDIRVNGGEAYTGPYAATFMLSKDESLHDPDDIIVAVITRNGTLPATGLTRLTRQITIPAVPPGQYYLLLALESNMGFANAGTNAPTLGVNTDFRIADVDISPHTLNLSEPFDFEWSASIENTGLNRALAEMDAILSRDRKIGNGDDVILGGESLPFLDLQPDQTGILSDFESIIGSAMPSGSYYFALRVSNSTDPTPKNNTFVSAKPLIEVIGQSETDGVVTMLGGAGLDAIITNDVPALRGNGTGFGPVLTDGGMKTITYALRNDGDFDLDILSVEGRGQHPGDFAISNVFPTTIAPGATQVYTITFDPTDYANRRANFLFTTSDPNREKFRMRIAGAGEAAATDPDIEVTGSAPGSSVVQEITNNDRDPATIDGSDFGRVLPGAQSTIHIFQIRNAGQSDLVFIASPDPDVSIRAQSGEAASSFLFGRNNPTTQGHLEGIPQTLRPGQTFNFRVRYSPGAFGQHKPWVEIYTNDPDEGKFRFKIEGLASPI